MPLIEDGRPVADDWIFVPDGEPLPDAPSLVSLDRWQVERYALTARNQPIGVRLRSDQPASAIAADLDRIALIAVEFPKFRDGRGFSTARELRERNGYAGPIRAVGHTIPDQYSFLLRCGFTQVEVPEGRDLSAWASAPAQVTVAYQPAMGEERPLSLLRRHVKAEQAKVEEPA